MKNKKFIYITVETQSDNKIGNITYNNVSKTTHQIEYTGQSVEEIKNLVNKYVDTKNLKSITLDMREIEE